MESDVHALRREHAMRARYADRGPVAAEPTGPVSNGQRVVRSRRRPANEVRTIDLEVAAAPPSAPPPPFRPPRSRHRPATLCRTVASRTPGTPSAALSQRIQVDCSISPRCEHGLDRTLDVRPRYVDEFAADLHRAHRQRDDAGNDRHRDAEGDHGGEQRPRPPAGTVRGPGQHPLAELDVDGPRAHATLVSRIRQTRSS